MNNLGNSLFEVYCDDDRIFEVEILLQRIPMVFSKQEEKIIGVWNLIPIIR